MKKLISAYGGCRFVCAALLAGCGSGASASCQLLLRKLRSSTVASEAVAESTACVLQRRC